MVISYNDRLSQLNGLLAVRGLLAPRRDRDINKDVEMADDILCGLVNEALDELEQMNKDIYKARENL